MRKIFLVLIIIQAISLNYNSYYRYYPSILQHHVYANKTMDDYNNYMKFISKGIDYYLNEQYEQAIKQFRLAITKKCDEFTPFMYLGDIYSNQEKYDLALNNYNKAISLAPYNSKLYVRRGITFSWINKYYSAMNDFNQAIVLDPNNVSAYLNRSKLYAQLEIKEKAIDDCNKAFHLDKTYTTYLSAAFVYNALHDYEKSVLCYENALMIAPEKRKAKIQMWLNKERQEYKASIDLHKIQDESAISYGMASFFYNRDGDYKTGYEYSSKALKLDKKYFWAYSYLGESLIGLHEYNKALEVISKGLKYAKNNMLLANLYESRGKIYLYKKNYKEAISDFNKSLTYEERADTYYLRGNAYKHMHEYNKAYADYQKAIILQSRSAHKSYYALEEITPYITSK